MPQINATSLHTLNKSIAARAAKIETLLKRIEAIESKLTTKTA